MTDLPDCARFAALVGERFAVTAADGATEMTLVAARPLAAAGGDPSARATFELEFDSSVTWPQGTYRFAHPALGEADIFVVPFAAGADGHRYHAVFN